MNPERTLRLTISIASVEFLAGIVLFVIIPRTRFQLSHTKLGFIVDYEEFLLITTFICNAIYYDHDDRVDEFVYHYV